LVVAVLAVIVLLRRQAAPEPARLLPGADAFVYVDLKWVRRLNRLGQVPQVPHDPEYDQFIRETGFQFERDLNEAAFAVHYAGTAITSKCASAAWLGRSSAIPRNFRADGSPTPFCRPITGNCSAGR